MTKKKLAHAFTVDRSKWGEAHTISKWGEAHTIQVFNQGSGLYNKRTGLMCCLGHICKSLGVPKTRLAPKGYPSSTNLSDSSIERLLSVGLIDDGGRSSQLSYKAADINDDSTITTRQRERKLKTLFAKYDIALTFTGKLPKPPKKGK